MGREEGGERGKREPSISHKALEMASISIVPTLLVRSMARGKRGKIESLASTVYSCVKLFQYARSSIAYDMNNHNLVLIFMCLSSLNIIFLSFFSALTFIILNLLFLNSRLFFTTHQAPSHFQSRHHIIKLG